MELSEITEILQRPSSRIITTEHRVFCIFGPELLEQVFDEQPLAALPDEYQREIIEKIQRAIEVKTDGGAEMDRSDVIRVMRGTGGARIRRRRRKRAPGLTRVVLTMLLRLAVVSVVGLALWAVWFLALWAVIT